MKFSERREPDLCACGETAFIKRSGQWVIVDAGDRRLLASVGWFINARGYVKVWDVESGRQIAFHRLLLGIDDPALKGDHRNHHTLDNRRSNLRIASPAQNSRNIRPQKTNGKGPCASSMKGVDFWNGTWRARIFLSGKRPCLGRFAKEEDAGRAYDTAAVGHYGEFAVLNFPVYPAYSAAKQPPHCPTDRRLLSRSALP